MVMAQMTAGWRCAGAFRPAAVALLHMIKGDARVEFRDVQAALGQQLLSVVVWSNMLGI
jgi:hypothetical protein